MYTPSNTWLEWLGEGLLYKLVSPRGPNCGYYSGHFRAIIKFNTCEHISSHPWAIIYVRPGTLGQVRHQCKSLSYVV